MQAGWRWRLRACALWATLGSLVLLSLLSPGVMPARDADGALILVLCTAEGTVETAVDPVTFEPIDASDQQHPDNAREYCPWFSLHSTGSLTAMAPIPARGGDMLPPMEFPLAETVLAAGRVTGLPPSTGPPLPV